MFPFGSNGLISSSMYLYIVIEIFYHLFDNE